MRSGVDVLLAGSGGGTPFGTPSGYAITFLLGTVALGFYAFLRPGWSDSFLSMAPAYYNTPEAKRLQALQTRLGFGIFVLTVTIPMLLVWAGVVPSSWESPGLLFFVFFNLFATVWFGHRIRAAYKPETTVPREGPLADGISVNVSAVVAGNKKILAVKAYQDEHPGCSLKQAAEAVDAFIAGGLPPQPTP